MRMLLPLAIAVAILPPGSADAAAPEGPGAAAMRFVNRLYGLSGPIVPEDATYTPALNRLIARAVAVSRATDDPDLVGNALCDCQDMSELKARTTLVSATASAASVRVRLTGGIDGPATFLLKLERTPAGWRVADSIAEPGGSYVRNLRAEVGGR